MSILRSHHVAHLASCTRPIYRATQNPLYVEDVETKSALFEAVTNVLVQYFWMLLPARGKSVDGVNGQFFQISHCS